MASHKRNFEHFVEPDYARVDAVNTGRTGDHFQAFLDECLATIPDEGSPADPYMYNSHMGAFVRTLDVAKDELLKAQLAFYASRGSANTKTDTKSSLDKP